MEQQVANQDEVRKYSLIIVPREDHWTFWKSRIITNCVPVDDRAAKKA